MIIHNNMFQILQRDNDLFDKIWKSLIFEYKWNMQMYLLQISFRILQLERIKSLKWVFHLGLIMSYRYDEKVEWWESANHMVKHDIQHANEAENMQMYELKCQFIKRVALNEQRYLVPVNYTQNNSETHQLMSVKSMGAKTRLFFLPLRGSPFTQINIALPNP